MSLTKKDIDITEMKAEYCRRNFYYFVREFIEVIEPNANNFVWNWHIEELCNELQELVFTYINDKRSLVLKKVLKELEVELDKSNPYYGRETYNLNVNICPGTSKSTIFSRMATAWIWTVMPEATIINVSRDSNNVKNFAIKCREIIQSDKYKSYFPYIKIKSTPDSIFYFENNHGGVRYGVSTTGKGSTGKHADFQIWDDVYSYTDTEGGKESITNLESYLDGLLSRFKDKDKGVIINVMQRLGHNDPTAYLFTGYNEGEPKLNNYRNVCLPAEISDLVNPPELKKKYVDGFLDPIRLSRKTLELEEQKFGFRYAAQYDQSAELSPEDLMYSNGISELESFPESHGGLKFSFTDPADGGDDYFMTWFIELINNELYVIDCIYTQEDSTTTPKKLADKIREIGSSFNVMEYAGLGITMFNQVRKEGINLKPYKTGTTSKEIRVKSQAHLIHKVHFLKNHPNPNYRKAVKHLKLTPKVFPNKGKGLDIDPADNISMGIDVTYKKFPQIFLAA